MSLDLPIAAGLRIRPVIVAPSHSNDVYMRWIMENRPVIMSIPQARQSGGGFKGVEDN
jgi:hypothetical protein